MPLATEMQSEDKFYVLVTDTDNGVNVNVYRDIFVAYDGLILRFFNLEPHESANEDDQPTVTALRTAIADRNEVAADEALQKWQDELGHMTSDYWRIEPFPKADIL